jgi:site-specific DNA-methyltransferase (cytosine-N4-specific)
MNNKSNLFSLYQSSPVQLDLFADFELSSKVNIEQFSSDKVCNDAQRINLENKYCHLFRETDEYNRKSVSFQANKQNNLHSWFHYKEGFSSQLVESFIKKLGIQEGDTLLEPFCGAGTSLLVAKQFNINSIGFDIFPLCSLIWEVKSNIEKYNLAELNLFYQCLSDLEPQRSDLTFPHLKITEFAFSEQNEQHLMFYTQWIDRIEVSDSIKQLFKFILVSILEEISYTRKDGQCLRWDYRSPKIQKRNELRRQQGKKI